MDRVVGFSRAGICRPCALIPSISGCNLCNACQRVCIQGVYLSRAPFLVSRGNSRTAAGVEEHANFVPRAATSTATVLSEPGSQSQVRSAEIENRNNKPKIRKGRFRSVPRKKIRDSGGPCDGGDIALREVAKALESAYRKDLSIPLADKSKYAKIIEDLEAQARNVGQSGSNGVSSSSPIIPVIRKRRGRPPGSTSKSKRAAAPAHQEENVSTVDRDGDGNAIQSLNAPVAAKKRPASQGKYRLNLVSRIALRERRLSNSAKAEDCCTNVGKAVLDIWSSDAEKLIANHGVSIDLGVIDWDNLEKTLLSAGEESDLARLIGPTKTLGKIRESLTMELGRDPLDEEWAAASQMDLSTMRRHLQLGKAARNKLIQRNLRLVLFQAHKYYRDSSSLSLYDLCQEGVSGLIHGVDKFDPQRGHRFSTYAIYWVRNSILRALTRSGSSVRSPYNVALHKLNIKKARLNLLVELERAPTDEEVMAHLGLSPERYRDILRSSARLASMNKPSAITGEELINTIEDDSARTSPGTGQAGDDASLRFGVGDVLDSLKPKENLVLRQRFGLDGRGERTLGEIGQTLGLSREMVRKYEMCALMKMKHPTRMEYLRSYLS